MTIPEMQRRILSDLDEYRAEIIRNHQADDLLYYEGYCNALMYVASSYLDIPHAVLGDNPSWQEDADAGRDWDDDGDEIADAYEQECARTRPQRLAVLDSAPSDTHG